MPRRYRKKFRGHRRSGLRKLAAGSFKSRSLPERHISDQVFDNATVNPLASNTPNSMNTIASGAGVGARIGRRISMKSLHIRGCVRAYSAVAPTSYQIPPAVRFMIIYDKEGGNPASSHAPYQIDAAEGVLDDLPAATWPATHIFNLKRWATRERYVVLVDRIIPLTTSASDGLDANQPMLGQAHFDFYIKLKGLQAVYDSDSSVGPTNGQLLFMYAKNAGGADAAEGFIMQMNARSRLLFYP